MKVVFDVLATEGNHSNRRTLSFEVNAPISPVAFPWGEMIDPLVHLAVLTVKIEKEKAERLEARNAS